MPRPLTASNRTSRVRLALSLLCLMAAQLTSCTYVEGRNRVLITSTPAGARILVDGTDTGLTTPATLDFSTWTNLDGYLSGEREIAIDKVGFERQTRRLYKQTVYYSSRWIDGAVEKTPPLPLYWTLGDWFTPFGVRWSYVPDVLHVKLYPEGEGPGSKPAIPKVDAADQAP